MSGDDWSDLGADVPKNVRTAVGQHEQAQDKLQARREKLAAQDKAPLLTAQERAALTVRAFDATLLHLTKKVESGRNVTHQDIAELSKLLNAYNRAGLKRDDADTARKEKQSGALVEDLLEEYAEADAAFATGKLDKADCEPATAARHPDLDTDF
jgi:hypothetical protein